MASSTIALIILAIVLVCLVSGKVPVVVTILGGMLAMTLTNCCTPAQAFSGFSGTAAMMIMGMNVVGAAFFTTGISTSIGHWLYQHGASSEKRFLLTCTLLAGILALFINPMAVISLFMPIIDSVASQSEGKIRRKMCYLPTGIAAIYGGTLTSVSTSTMVNALGMLESTTGQTISFFTPATMTLGGVVLMYIVIGTFGYKLMDKWFDFEEPPMPTAAGSGVSGQQVNKVKAGILVAVLVLCIIGFVWTKLNMGVIALTAACVLILTGCISTKDAFQKISWTTVVIVGAGVGFGAGIQYTGAGEVLANAAINLVGTDPFLLCVIIVLIATFLSNLMANNAALVIVAPLAIAVAQKIGYDVLPFIMATACGANYSVATMLSNASVTITAPAGYRFKGVLYWGGLVNLFGVVCGIIGMKIFFF